MLSLNFPCLSSLYCEKIIKAHCEILVAHLHCLGFVDKKLLEHFECNPLNDT